MEDKIQSSSTGDNLDQPDSEDHYSKIRIMDAENSSSTQETRHASFSDEPIGIFEIPKENSNGKHNETPKIPSKRQRKHTPYNPPAFHTNFTKEKKKEMETMMLYIDGRLGASLAESAEHRDSDDEQEDKTPENEKSNVGENQNQDDKSGNSRASGDSEDSEDSEELQELAIFKPRKLGKRERKHTPYNPPSMQAKLIKQYKKDNIAEEYQTLISESESEDDTDIKEPERSKERDSCSVKKGDHSRAVQDSEDSDHFHDCEDSHIDVLEEYLYSRSMDSSQYLPSSGNSSSSAFPPTSSLSSMAIKTFKDRLADIPIYVENKDKIISLYTNAKDSHFVGGVMNNAEEIARSYLPYSKIQPYDEGAAEILGKINEKFSILQQTPSRIADISKSTVTNTAVVCAQMVRNSSVFERFSRGLDGGVALCEIALEACLPTDLSDQQDLEELRRSHDDESISGNVIGNASSLVKRATSRGGKRLRCYSNSISSKFIGVGGNEQGPVVTEYENFSENDVLLEIRNFRNWERVYSSRKMLTDQLNATLSNSAILPNKIVAFTGKKDRSKFTGYLPTLPFLIVDYIVWIFWGHLYLFLFLFDMVLKRS